MNDVRPFLLNGEWVRSNLVETIFDRYDGSAVGSCCLADAVQVEQAVAGCAAAFAKTRDLPALERASLLQRVAAGIGEREEEFVALLVREAGKPRDFALAEIARARQTFSFAASETLLATGETLPLDASPPGKNHSGVVRRVPLGVIFGITPFNFPLNLVAHKIAPALATGNAILIKPALKTPLIGLLLAEVLVTAGCLPGQVNILPFHHDLITPLFTDPRIKMTSFTGSAEVGWKIKTQAIKQRVCLELGGNAALIVHPDAAWQSRIPAIAAGAFGYAGQSCISIQRLLVQETIYTEVRSALAEYVAEKVISGNPVDAGVMLGPLIDRSALEKLTGWIESALGAGASSVFPVKSEGPTLFPVILENVPRTEPIYCEEAFGPVLVLEKYGTFEEALELVNDSRYGLQAGVLTSDLNLAQRSFEVLEVGAVLINQIPTFRLENMPYGGVKDSGFGREGVRYSMEEMTELKLMIINHAI